MPWTVLLLAAGEPDTPAPTPHCFTRPHPHPHTHPPGLASALGQKPVQGCPLQVLEEAEP